MGLNEFPDVVVYDEALDEADAGRALAGALAGHGIEAPLVVAADHGRGLVEAISSPVEGIRPPLGADQSWAAELGGLARHRGADALVAIGGGRCLDVTKLAAARAGLKLVAVPTQPSHDGICSPVAVVPDGPGCGQSIGAIAPRLVFVSIPTLLTAPPASVAAGIGDLLANPLALEDWALAARHGLEVVDRRAWELSVESFERIACHLEVGVDRTRRDPALMRALADALVTSGLAMICAGTSRPASGAEHEISHAIDDRFSGRAMHGAQVAFGCIVSAALHGDDLDLWRERVRRLGLPHHPSELRFSEDDVVDLLLWAPRTRPGRFTVLEDSDLDEGGARALVRRIWGRWR